MAILIVVFAMFIAFFLPLIKDASLNTSLRDMILNVHNLLDAVNGYIKHPTRFRKLKLRLAISGTDLYSYISPIEKDWYKEERYQWLSTSEISKETRSVLFVMSNFRKAIRADIKKNADISLYLPTLLCVEVFLLSLANRTSKGKFQIIDLDSKKDEYDILVSGAKSARPLILQSIRVENRDKDESRFFLAVRSIIQSSVVKYALSISGIAAAVMLLGVLLFRLDASQAFLTWFTVTFGSLSISIGAASFREIQKSRTKSQLDNVDQ